mmetsp:Transcript_2133/g.7740  ORF Transcript_2133/g.7740 Transcript_2133/m.7740 type:complete len:95 (+) Transcript_2133:5303-5587(+)
MDSNEFLKNQNLTGNKYTSSQKSRDNVSKTAPKCGLGHAPHRFGAQSTKVEADELGQKEVHDSLDKYNNKKAKYDRQSQSEGASLWHEQNPQKE